jgi:hypothetical protein
MIKHGNTLIVGLAAAVALFSGTAYAGTVTNPLLSGTVTISDGGSTAWNLPSSAPYTTNPDGTFNYIGSVSSPSLWAFTWNVTVDPDPLISATFGITNNTDITKHFDLLFTLPVGSPFGMPAQKSGSLGATFQDLNGNLDLNGNSVTLSNISWAGKIDGVDAMSLFSGDFSCGGAGCIGSIFPVSDGPLSSTGVNTNIGIHLSFDLTARDKATFTTSFEVVPTVVPIPAAVWLFGSGLLGLGAFIRRRKN